MGETTMTAAIYHGPRDIRVERIARPQPGPGEALVQVRACGICGTDLHVYRQGLFEDIGRPVGQGRVLGHEHSGVVVEVGAGVERVRPGERVVMAGLGGFAEYVPVEASAGRIFVLPDQVSFEVAATIEPLAASLHTAELAAPRPAQTVVILGAGIIGLGCLQALKATSPARVIVVDGVPLLLAMARQLGADAVVDRRAVDPVTGVLALTGELEWPGLMSYRSGQADVVIDAAGAPYSTQQGIEMLRPEGRLVVVALFEESGPLDRNQIVRKGITVVGSWGTGGLFERALRLVADGRIDRRPLITHEFPLAEAPAAFALQERAGAIKVLIKP
jgi:2-desacetyl-2-hydroxyethyl bacteriochlorophyllide A dehydrogenase